MGWICWKTVIQQMCSSSAIAVAIIGLGLIQRLQVGKLPEGHEEETPISVLKVHTEPLAGREGAREAARCCWGRISPENTALCSKHELMGGSEQKPRAEKQIASPG